jgi:NAD(P)-dependent dehydrogenase (short-subunit alcohol dehydrogenase family)
MRVDAIDRQMTANDSPAAGDLLSERVCIVTGAGNGLGRYAAEELAARGASVIVNDLGTSVRGEGADPSVVEDTASSIREAGGEARAHHGDVTQPETATDLIDTAVAEYGRVDGIANFAGVLRDGWLQNLSDEDWQTVLATNLGSHFFLLRAAVRHWRSLETEDLEPQRSFVGVSSRGAMGNPGQINYSATKAGVLGLVRAASTELYRQNVRVNALIPSGYTRMTETVPEEHRPYTREEMPPERVAPMVSYLMSEAAADVTGCTLYAGGDRIGLYSDPQLERVGVNPGGWSAEEIAQEMDETIADGFELTRTERFL